MERKIFYSELVRLYFTQKRENHVQVGILTALGSEDLCTKLSENFILLIYNFVLISYGNPIYKI